MNTLLLVWVANTRENQVDVLLIATNINSMQSVLHSVLCNRLLFRIRGAHSHVKVDAANGAEHLRMKGYGQCTEWGLYT